MFKPGIADNSPSKAGTVDTKGRIKLTNSIRSPEARYDLARNLIPFGFRIFDCIINHG